MGWNNQQGYRWYNLEQPPSGKTTAGRLEGYRSPDRFWKSMVGFHEIPDVHLWEDPIFRGLYKCSFQGVYPCVFFVALFSPMPLKLPWEPTAVSLSTAISPIFRAQNFHLSWVSNMSSFAWFFVTLLSGDDPISNCFNSVETTFPSWLMKICKSNLLCLNLESSTSMVPSKKYLIWTSSFYVFSFFQS